jgi:hypothetical protein
MSALLILLLLLPLSFYRQMHAHEISPMALVRLPLLYAGIGLLGFGTRHLDVGGDAAPYFALSAVLSISQDRGVPSPPDTAQPASSWLCHWPCSASTRISSR